MHRVNRKTERVVVRCTPETRRAWLEVLYEMRKRGLTAEDVLREALRQLRNSPLYLGGDAY